MEGMEPGYPLDSLIAAADRALRAVFAPAHASRPVPDVPKPIASSSEANASSEASAAQSTVLSEADRLKSASLMRVNHAGEVAAQALYHGQALVSRSPATRELLLNAAHEESDHLAWCETRLQELGSRPSLLNPLWYLGSFGIGALAAAIGDRTSLGFVVETERQVEGHLDEHLTRLPADDTRSRAILNMMRTDEIGHGAAAKAAGAAELPAPLRVLMRHTARIMTTAAYWI
jgi:3-demethoxyubiquinol 3-hydroxylase